MTPRSEPVVSVVICTYRRPDFLRAALDSLTRQTVPPDLFEVIVVDNNSGPPTPEVAQEYAQHCSYELKYVLESSQGISHARNAGIGAARADLIAFLDDDEVAHPNWLAAHLGVYETTPEVSAVAGRVWLIWNNSPPNWLMKAGSFGELGRIDWGDEPHILQPPEYLGTGNSSFRKEVFDEVGLFDVGLPRGEDTDMERRLRDTGHTVFYSPHAIIYHEVPDNKLTRRFFYRAAFRRGRQRVQIETRESARSHPVSSTPGSLPKPGGQRRWLAGKLAPMAVTMVGIATRRGAWLNTVRQVFYTCGVLYESARMFGSKNE